MFFNTTYVTVCASKYFDESQMRKLFEKGILNFGENKVQDLLKKKALLSDLSLVWHFIGHLQSNKVKSMINEIDYLHTLDRLSLAEQIQKHAHQSVQCFIQVNLTEENQKSGLFVTNLPQFLDEIQNYDKIKVVGLMTMGKDDDLIKTEAVFEQLDELSRKYNMPYRSMGMSNDYELAIKHHATHLRIGRKCLELLD